MEEKILPFGTRVALCADAKRHDTDVFPTAIIVGEPIPVSGGGMRYRAILEPAARANVRPQEQKVYTNEMGRCLDRLPADAVIELLQQIHGGFYG